MLVVLDAANKIIDFPPEFFTVYEGNFDNDLLHGFGRHVVMNGTYMVGHFK